MAIPAPSGTTPCPQRWPTARRSHPSSPPRSDSRWPWRRRWSSTGSPPRPTSRGATRSRGPSAESRNPRCPTILLGRSCCSVGRTMRPYPRGATSSAPSPSSPRAALAAAAARAVPPTPPPSVPPPPSPPLPLPPGTAQPLDPPRPPAPPASPPPPPMSTRYEFRFHAVRGGWNQGPTTDLQLAEALDHVTAMPLAIVGATNPGGAACARGPGARTPTRSSTATVAPSGSTRMRARASCSSDECTAISHARHRAHAASPVRYELTAPNNQQCDPGLEFGIRRDDGSFLLL